VADAVLGPADGAPEPSPRVTREVAGFEFPLVPGARISGSTRRCLARMRRSSRTTVASDLLRRTGIRSIVRRPAVIYVSPRPP